MNWLVLVLHVQYWICTSRAKYAAAWVVVVPFGSKYAEKAALLLGLHTAGVGVLEVA